LDRGKTGGHRPPGERTRPIGREDSVAGGSWDRSGRFDLYLLVIEKAPGGSFFFAENGNNSFKEVAEMMSAVLGFGGRPVSLPVEDVILQHGEAGRLGVASNSLVSAANARRLGWSPKAPALAEYLESLRVPEIRRV